MAGLDEFRRNNPAYAEVPDADLAVALHRKYYSNVPMVDYIDRLGLDRGNLLYDLRAPDNKAGTYLREQLAAPGSSESADEAAKRYGGAIEERRAGNAEGMARAYTQGGTFGFGDEIVAAGAAALDPLVHGERGKDFGQRYDAYLGRERGLIDNYREDSPVAAFGTEIAGAIPTGVMAGGQLAGRGGSLLPRALSGSGVGAAQGYVYGAGSSDGDISDRVASAFDGGIVGGVVGGAMPVAAAMAGRIVSPTRASADKIAAAAALEREGVELTAGQRTGSRPLQFMEAELGGGATANKLDQQGEQFTAAVLNRIGVKASRATPEVLANAGETIGKRLDDLAANTDVPLDAKLQNDLLGVVSNYLDVAGAPAPAVERLMNRISELASRNGGVLTGRAYQAIRSKMGQYLRSADGQTSEALSGIREALDDAVERNSSPALVSAWQSARDQYRNLLVVERAATGAGENAASGLITPAQLRSAAIGQNRRAFARGKSDFTDLANAGVASMAPPAQGGRTSRLASKAIAAAPAVMGGMAGAPVGMEAALLGTLVGAGVPAGLGRLLLSKPIQVYAGNQALTPGGQKVLDAMMSGPAVPAAMAWQGGQ